MKLVEAVNRERMSSIYLRDLLDVLRIECKGSATDPFAVLGTLLHYGGLRVAVSAGGADEGDPIHWGSLQGALDRVARESRGEPAEPWTRGDRWDRLAREQGGGPDKPDIWRHEVSVHAGKPHRYVTPVGFLWVKESEYAAACRRLGSKEYRWPASPGPITEANLVMRAVPDIPKREKDGYTVEEASQALVRQQGWDDETRYEWIDWATPAIRDGRLPVQHPKTGETYRPNAVMLDYEWMTADDLNTFLAAEGVAYRLATGGSNEAPKDEQPRAPTKGTVQEVRTNRLLRWLDEQGIPEGERIPLRTGWTLGDIFDQLKHMDEFLVDGLLMEFSTFRDDFWRKQKVTKLPRGRKRKSG